VLKRGQKLPSEEELASSMGQPYDGAPGIADLIDEGLLYRRHGVGLSSLSPRREATSQLCSLRCQT
jgi:DNA-binding GntR family transcriptional regulator